MRLLITCALGLMLAACSGNTSEPQKVEATKAAPLKTAAEVVDAFKGAGLKITDVKVVTESNDDNNLLGRPGQYSSKVFFRDARHPVTPDSGDEGENSVEFFATADDAKTRHDYIEGVTKGIPMLLQYQLLHGNVLVRLDKVALPSEVEEYKKILEGLEMS